MHFVLSTDVGHGESQTLLYIASKQCRCLITDKPQSIVLQMVRPPVLLHLSYLGDEAAMTMFRGTLLV